MSRKIKITETMKKIILYTLFFNLSFLSCTTQKDNNTSSSETTEKITSYNCSICGREFSHNGYQEVSEGVWERLSDPYQSMICSESCGLKHTREWDKIRNSY